ncbi:MAG: aminomethyltransferase [Pseudorhodobacter sp.]|jgi:aminomethyltransferase
MILGAPSHYEAQDTATPLTVTVTRAVIRSHVKLELPDPLADP